MLKGVAETILTYRYAYAVVLSSVSAKAAAALDMLHQEAQDWSVTLTAILTIVLLVKHIFDMHIKSIKSKIEAAHSRADLAMKEMQAESMRIELERDKIELAKFKKELEDK